MLKSSQAGCESLAQAYMATQWRTRSNVSCRCFPQRRRVPRGWTELRQEAIEGTQGGADSFSIGLSRCGKIFCSRREFMGGPGLLLEGRADEHRPEWQPVLRPPARDFVAPWNWGL